MLLSAVPSRCAVGKEEAVTYLNSDEGYMAEDASWLQRGQYTVRLLEGKYEMNARGAMGVGPLAVRYHVAFVLLWHNGCWRVDV